MRRYFGRLTAAFALTLVLAGCRVELYSGLQEKNANEMLAVLMAHGIPASKTLGKGNIASVLVDESDVAASIEILGSHGYPKDEFASLGEIFQKEGLISSPLEEKVRFLYGLSQTIAETLSQIDGVQKARVHIVLPETQPLDPVAKPSAASVFIKYRPGMGIESAVPKIKMIVQNSVEGLSYDKISVALFPVQELRSAEPAGPPMRTLLGVRVAKDSLGGLAALVGALGGLLLLALSSSAYLFWRMRRAAVLKGEGSG